MDERGHCRIVGRLKDMIIRGGENLFPVEIEEVLYRHPAVAEVAVVGLPDVIGRGRRSVHQASRSKRVTNDHRTAFSHAGPPVTAEDAHEVVRRGQLPTHRIRQDPEVRSPRGMGTWQHAGLELANSRHRSIWCWTGTDSTTLGRRLFRYTRSPNRR